MKAKTQLFYTWLKTPSRVLVSIMTGVISVKNQPILYMSSGLDFEVEIVSIGGNLLLDIIWQT